MRKNKFQITLNSNPGVNVGIPDEDVAVVEEVIEAIIGPVDEPETALEEPVSESPVDKLYRVCDSVFSITDDTEGSRVRHYLEALYLKHGDKTEALIYGFESLYGLTMLAALSGIETNNTFPISGSHMNKANQHYKKVIKNV